MTMLIRTAEIEDVPAIASLHVKGIATGFISSLGEEFVQALYKAVLADKTSCTLVAQDDSGVKGFVAFTQNLNKLYRSIILKSGFRFAVILAGKLFSIKKIKRVFGTLLYPSHTGKLNLPKAELLAIAIAPEGRRSGIATRLVIAGLQACAARSIDEVKVMVAENNTPANRLYQKCGFKPLCKIDSHGTPSNIYVAQILTL